MEPVTRNNADNLYQDMWDRAPKRRPDGSYVTPWGELLIGMISHCDAAALLYPDDEYRRCMWQYRAYLHRKGDHVRVWLGNDPVECMRKIAANQGASLNRSESRQPTGEAKHRDKHHRGWKKAPRAT